MDRTNELPSGVRFGSVTPATSHLIPTKLVCALIAGVSLISSLASVCGYSLEGKTWPLNSVIPLQFGLGNPPQQLQDGNTTWNGAAMPVINLWNQQMLRARLTGISNPSVPVSSGDHINAVVFSNTIFGQSFGQGTLAVTYYRTVGANMTEADVLFNRNQQFNSYRGPLQFGSNGYAIGDIRRVLLHELGHGLGLDHPDSHGQNVDAVMNSIVSNRETPSADDITGIRSLYGAPAGGGGSSTPILWQNNSTGHRHIWNMTGTVHTGGASLGVVATQWNIAASGDLNGDGKADIVWENHVTGARSVWMMNGATHTSSASLGIVAPAWRIASAADFNRDGKVDLVWQHNTTGGRAIWLMNGTAHVSTVNLGIVAPRWKIKGSGDFNGDEKADLLWQDDISGARSVWIMNGTARSSSVSLGVVALQWDMIGTGEFNGDGKRDILFHNTGTGQRSIWLMNRTTRLASVSLGVVAAPWDARNY